MGEVTASLHVGRCLVGGEWLEGEVEVEDRDPGNGELVGHVYHGTTSTVDAAVAVAQDALAGWSARTPLARAGYLDRAATELERDLEDWALLISREMGKPLRDARGECARAIRSLRFFAGEAQRSLGESFGSEQDGTWLITRREPIGVVAVITPWNFPAAIPAWKAAPALVFGNTVVLKLAEDAPLSGLRLVQALMHAGLPPGVLNVVLGHGQEVGRALTTHPGVDAVAFTGSSAVGRSIIASAGAEGKRVQLEMGGHNPAVVRHDANLDTAVSAIAYGAFGEAGQKCTATRRVYVHEDVAAPFLERLVAKTGTLRVGYGLDESTEIGPLVNRRQLDGVVAALEGIDAHGIVLRGGRRLEDGPFAEGFYFEPTIVTELANDHQLACEEVFGPVLSVWAVSDDEEALTRANRTPYGLSAAVHTASLDAARTYIAGMNAGLVRVNAPTTGAEVHVPFGGWGISGHGPSEQGRSAIEFFSRTKTVSLTPAALT